MLKKWWLWTIIGLSCIIIALIGVIIYDNVFNKKSEDISLSKEISSIYPESETSISKDSGTITIELHHYSNEENTDQLSQIMQIIREKKEKGELQGYKKLKTITYMDNDEEEENMVIIDTANIDTFTQEESASYILFEEYQSLYSTLEKTMDSYSELFNSVY